MKKTLAITLFAAGLGLGALGTAMWLPAAGAQHMQHGAHGHAHGHGAPATDAAGETPSTRAYRQINARMHAAMEIDFTGDADVDFMRGMIPHHQAAIEMAEVVLEHGSDPQVRALAEAIIAAQREEIAFMEGWLAER